MSNKTEPIKSEPTAPLDEGLSRNPYLPVNLAERKKEKEAIKAEQAARSARMYDCLDPTVAKSYEDRKSLFEWRVEVKLFRPAIGRQPAQMEEINRQVVAHNESDAWAMFCDAIGEWPSKRGANPKITRLKKRSLRDPSFESFEQEQAAAG